MKQYNVAVLGATGAVGQELLSILVERQFPFADLRLLASPRSAGRRITIGSQEYVVEAVSEESFANVDIAFFAAGGSVSKRWAEAAVRAGALVIDNTSAFRLEPDVPLVVPEVNGEAIASHKGIIANPNCSTIIMVMALKPILDEAGIKRVVVSTYQAVSGAGFGGMEELRQQTEDYVMGRELDKVLPVSSESAIIPSLLILFRRLMCLMRPGTPKKNGK